MDLIFDGVAKCLAVEFQREVVRGIHFNQGPSVSSGPISITSTK